MYTLANNSELPNIHPIASLTLSEAEGEGVAIPYLP
jgi:hypothetical protein